jgi:hypothetical protein
MVQGSSNQRRNFQAKIDQCNSSSDLQNSQD